VTFNPPPLPQESRKRILPAFLLCLVIAGHRLYAGKIWTGLAQIAWLAGAFLWLEKECAGLFQIVHAGGITPETIGRVAEWEQIHGPPLGPMLALIGAGIWVAVDASLLVARKFTDRAGRRIVRWI
jgi:hypothetical protein